LACPLGPAAAKPGNGHGGPKAAKQGKKAKKGGAQRTAPKSSRAPASGGAGHAKKAKTNGRAARAAAVTVAPAAAAPVAPAPTTTRSRTRTRLTGAQRARARAITRRRARARARRRSQAAARRRARANTAPTLAAAASAGPVSAAIGAVAVDTPQEPAAPKEPKPKPAAAKPDPEPTTVTRVIRDVVEEIPPWVNALLLFLGAAAAALLFALLLSGRRAAALAKRRKALERDVGSLQAALLPRLPKSLDGVAASAAYRPADGPAAGGDFYDVFPLPGGAVGLVVGDMSGHGREALAPTAFLRYTLRAHMESGDDLRGALRQTSGALERASYSGFATVLAAVLDPKAGTLTYAPAGHPPPIVVPGPEPVLVAAAPPLGLGLKTGLRSTTVSVGPDSTVCLFTDGLTEARTATGLIGRAHLRDIVEELGEDATADTVIERVASTAERLPDDLTVCLLRPTAGEARHEIQVEELDVPPGEADVGRRFLAACGVGGQARRNAEDALDELLARGDTALVRVVKGGDEAPIAHVESVDVGASLA
jgi:serine phosphatase RsbU (regulator of sigma subunit)